MLHTQNLVIGFGKAGKTLAADLANHGQDVILVEQSAQMYGGTCINIGCIPSKKLLVEGEQQHLLDDKVAAFQAAMQRKNDLVEKLRAANFARLDALDKVQVITAQAQFIDEHSVLLTDETGKTQTVQAERIFINTGAQSARLNVAGEDGARVLDSTGLLSLTERPKRLVVIGAGVIGLEFAFAYQSFGTEVTILNAGDTFLSHEDRDVAEEVLRILANKNIQLVLNAKTSAFDEQVDAVVVKTNQGDFIADAVLVAVGRVPNTAALQLDKAGIATNERGFIVTDDQLRVQGKAHIWAMGDVAGSPMFTSISLDDYRIVRNQLLGDGKRNRRDREIFPAVTFIEPPLAQIGMNEAAAIQSGREIVVCKMKAESIVKAKVLRQTDGLLKAIVDKQSGEILGATLFCAEAHELINLFKMAMDFGVPARYMKNQIFSHPVMAEALNDLFADLE